MTLAPDHFREFFFAVHQCLPFPWQERLLREVLEHGWPETLGLPTATGKTAILDVAVYALACQSGLATCEHRSPRRIALVVDRRIVVDDAFARASRICRALAQPAPGILAEVAKALRALGGETPLDVAVLRGGIYREDRWARTPTQPVILCSTVDQVGSRLLFRGYGISAGMAPIHAGLLGNDALIILDEAHCSQPFLQTLACVARLRGNAEACLRVPFAVVAMSATSLAPGLPFVLDAADYDHEVLGRRLAAHKHARLVLAMEKEAGFVRSCIEQIRLLAQPGMTILVVVNRVAAARAVRRALDRAAHARAPERLDADAVLLTGRVRPLDRDGLIRQWRHRLMAGRDRSATASDRPLVVVATQCVEVGADFDVDALVSECCALDALRQRLGRLDRLGELDNTPVVVLCRPEVVGSRHAPAEDPIYGQAASRTWHYLNDTKGDADSIDLGTLAIDGGPGRRGILPGDLRGRAEVLGPLATPPAAAPMVFPTYCDLWAQTGPEPALSPDPAVFLHGPERGEGEVRLVWRADIDPERPGSWADTISHCPPVAAEALPLPLHVARQWLGGALIRDVGSDLEGEPLVDAPDTRAATGSRLPVLRWRGPESSSLLTVPEDIRNGDVLLLPTGCGGCDSEGWNADAASPVSDLADAARAVARRPAVLRLHPSLAAPECCGEELARLAALATDLEWPEDLESRVWAAVGAAATREGLAPALAGILQALSGAPPGTRQCLPHPSGIGFIVSCDARTGAEPRDFSDEDNTSPRSLCAVPLSDHTEDVAARTAACAAAMGLPEVICRDLALAARLHDLGKADPRFQAWLAGGDPIGARHQGLLAKSRRLPTNTAALQAARERSGYPEGGRHELLSVRLAESTPALLDQAHDRDLVLHIVASHHGNCRPFAPVVFDERPVAVQVHLAELRLAASSVTGLERLDSGVSGRFWRLLRRYGWWGQAYLETCLRLADHRASEAPRLGG